MSKQRIEVGMYVQYQKDSQTYLVVQVSGNWVKIATNKHQGKKQVSAANLKVLPYTMAQVVEWEGNEYLVTEKLNIWSLTSLRLCKWHDWQRERKGILYAYHVAVGNLYQAAQIDVSEHGDTKYRQPKGVVYPSMRAYMKEEFGSDCD
jgi:hypothetical protein